MSIESKIDDIRETVYEMRPVVARLDENLKSVELRLGFIERNNARMDERVTYLEKKSERKPPHWRVNVHDTLEMVAAIPIAAHLIPSILMFLVALATFVHEYIKGHQN